MFEKQTLFEARTNGYHNYRVPGILATQNNIILATAEARRGNGGDWDGNDILLRRSLDGGVNWQPAQIVLACEDYGPGPLSNFVMVNDERHDARSGAIHVLFCHNYARVYSMRSEDGGATFSTPNDITAALEGFRSSYAWKVIATGPGHGIQLDSGDFAGRFVVPVWISDGSGTEFGAGKLGHRPSNVAAIYSDDFGQSWQCGDQVVYDSPMISNPSETIPVQLSNGRVLFNIRSESAEKRRLIATSADGATDWQLEKWDEALLEPVCMASTIKLAQQSDQGINYIAFANPDNLENELTPPGRNLAHDRKRLTIKLSPDDCDTWTDARVIEAGPSGYSDLAQATDGHLLCIYEDGMLDRMTDTKALTVARFDLGWVMENVG